MSSDPAPQAEVPAPQAEVPPPPAEAISPTRRRAKVKQQVQWTTNIKLSLKTWTQEEILTEFKMDKNQWAILDAQVHSESRLN